MRVCTVIADIKSREVGKPLVERLSRMWPEFGDGGFNFYAIIPEGDSRIPRILAELHGAGLTKEPTGKWNAYKPGKEYALGKTVEYEESDFATARYVSWTPKNLSPCFEEMNDGEPPVRLLSLEASLKKKLFGGTDMDHLITSSAGRALLEKQGFIGLGFVPAFWVDERGDIDALRNSIAAGDTPDLGVPDIWEVRPAVMLPSMLPLTFTHHVNGERRITRNPIDVDWRMAYSKETLDRAGSFDIARPSERGEYQSRHLVLSQRFFQFLKKQKRFTKEDCLPVREE